MRKLYSLIQIAGAVLSILAGCLLVLVFALSALPHLFPHQRLPLSRVRGVVTSEGVVFVASADAGRVYKFDYAGNLLDWFDTVGRPISISRLQWYPCRFFGAPHGKQWVAPPSSLDDGLHTAWISNPKARLLYRPLATAAVNNNKLAMAWYLTVVQAGWPGHLTIVATIGCAALALWARGRRRRLP